jgi:hypothetical protein
MSIYVRNVKRLFPFFSVWVLQKKILFAQNVGQRMLRDIFLPLVVSAHLIWDLHLEGPTPDSAEAHEVPRHAKP